MNDDRKLRGIFTDEGIIITVDGLEVMKIDVFLDKSHPGIHMFLEPLDGAKISKSEDGLPWTHELLIG